jgi:hypothetical protein
VQRIKTSAPHVGQLARVWADEFTVHVLIGSQLVKTVPYNLSAEDLATLRMRGAPGRGAAPAPARAGALPGGIVIEIDRMLDAGGTADVAGHRIKAGPELARRRVTPSGWTGTSSMWLPAASWPTPCPAPSSSSIS